MNHRMGQRIPASHKVSLWYTERGCVDGRLVNISLTGAAIQCRNWKSLELYTPVVVNLELRDGDSPERVSINGFVVRIQEGLIGLMFMKDVIDLINRLKSDTTKNHHTRRGDQFQVTRPLFLRSR